MGVSTIAQRAAIYLRSLAEQAAEAGIATLSANKSTYLSGVAAGAVIATLSDPYGSGSTFSVVGAAPATLALASGGRIVAGNGAQTAGQASTIVVRAAKGSRALEEALSFTAQGGTPTPTPTPTPNATLRGAAYYNPVNSNSFAANNFAHAHRIGWVVAGATPALRLAYSGKYLSNQTGITANENDLPISRSYIEINGIVRQVTWDGGATSKTIVAGTDETLSDILNATDFGYGSDFPAGVPVWLKTEILFTAATGFRIPYAADHVMADIVGQQRMRYDPAATTVKLDGTGAITSTGTAPTTGAVINTYRPMLLGMLPAVRRAWIVFGDSQSAPNPSYVTTGNGTFGRGWIGGTMQRLGHPCINMGVSGVGASAATANNSFVTTLLKYANGAVILLGTNNFAAAGTSASAAQVRTAIDAYVTSAKTAGHTARIVAKLLPRATSTTDAWATPGGQTIPPGWQEGGAPYALNDGLVVDANITGIIPQLAIRDPNDRTRWRTNGTASAFVWDETHDNFAGHQLRRDEALPILQAAN